MDNRTNFQMEGSKSTIFIFSHIYRELTYTSLFVDVHINCVWHNYIRTRSIPILCLNFREVFLKLHRNDEVCPARHFVKDDNFLENWSTRHVLPFPLQLHLRAVFIALGWHSCVLISKPKTVKKVKRNTTNVKFPAIVKV